MGTIDRPSMLRLLAPLVLLGSVLHSAVPVSYTHLTLPTKA